MSDEEAEAALAALAGPLVWQWDTSFGDYNGYWTTKYNECRYSIATHSNIEPGHACALPWYLKVEDYPIYRRPMRYFVVDCATVAEAKSACALHAATGSWAALLRLQHQAQEAGAYSEDRSSG